MQIMTRVVIDDRRLREMIGEMNVAAEDAVDAAADAIVQKAQELVPVRTGFLKSTIQKVVAGAAIRLVTALAPYSQFVEFGTSRMAAQPFLRPALESLNRRAIAEVFYRRLGLR